MLIKTITEDIRAMVRPVISLIFTVAVVAGFFRRQISGDVIVGILGPIIGFWFGEKSALKNPNQTGGN